MNDNDQLADLFLAESRDMLLVASNALLEAEKTGDFDDAINQLFRSFHSIKGGAMSLDLLEMAELAHRLEDLLDLARNGALVISAELISLIFQGIDCLDSLLQAPGDRQEADGSSGKERAILLAAITQEIERIDLTEPVAELPVSVAEPVNIPPDSRIIYFEAGVSDGAAMPSVTLLLMIQRLEEFGEIVFSTPTKAELLYGTAVTPLLRVLLVSRSDDAAIFQAVNIPDVVNEHFCVVTDKFGKKPEEVWPNPETIDKFQRLVAQMSEAMELGEVANICQYAEDIAAWEKEGNVGAWFAGGKAAWRGLTGLLVCCTKLLYETGDPVVKLRVQEGLAALWNTVFDALDCDKYFMTIKLTVSDSLSECDILRQILASPDTRFVLVDLTETRIQEYVEVQALLDIKRQLAEHKIKLTLVGHGASGRSHQNVLEAVAALTGGLAVWPTAYEACWRTSLEDRVL